MAQLSTIIGSILRDMVLAQHQANMYARMLSHVYSKDGALENFPLPSIALGEMELDLNYGVVSDSVSNSNANSQDGENENFQYEINYVELPKILGNLTDSYAKIIVLATNSTLKKFYPLESSTEENPLAEIVTDPDKKSKLEEFLSRKILEKIRSEFPRLINESKGAMRDKVLKDCVISISETEILNHADLKDFFEAHPDSKERVRTSIKNAIEVSSEKLLENVNVMRRRILPSADVIVGCDELAKLPSDSIQRIHLKLSPSNVQLYE